MRGCGSAKRASLVTRRWRSACSPTCRRPRRARLAPPGLKRPSPPTIRSPHFKPSPRRADRATRAATGDPPRGALAISRGARVLVRLGDAGAREALSGSAQSFPSDTAAPTALYMLGDMLGDRGEWSGAARWFGDLIARYPADLRASLARFRLPAPALRDGGPDGAAALFHAG